MRSILGAPAVKGIAGGLAGVVVGLLVWHLYTDHVAFHLLLDYLNTHAAAINNLGLPAAPTP